MVELSRSFELECEIIDRDHKQLIELINKIIAAIDGERADECAELAPKFVKFAKQHFHNSIILPVLPTFITFVCPIISSMP